MKTDLQSLKDTIEEIDDAEKIEDIEDKVWDIEFEIDVTEEYINNALDSIGHFLAFVKTFDESEFGTIYTEREWRSTEAFSFSYKDIAMVVLPKKVGANIYYEKFLDEEISRIGVPKEIPVVPWEDLVEH